MLTIYTFIFSEVFQSRWAGGTGSRLEFAEMLFAGLTVYGLFAECLTRAPSLIVGNVNFVKKVVFPIEILPWIALCASLFHAAMSLAALLLFSLLIHHSLPWSVFLFPIVLSPLILLTMGLSWILASLGVFIRDIAQTVGIAVSVLLFLSPIFYPVTSLPKSIQPLWNLNPLTFIIEQARLVLISGKAPDWIGLSIYALISFCVAWAGLWWFQRTRRAFADVL